MWIEKFFENGIKLEYKSENGTFEVKCTASSQKIVQGSVLYCLTNTENKSNRIRIGSFFIEQNMMNVKKKYSVSYMLLNGIDPGADLDFEITDSTGRTLCQTEKNNNRENPNSEQREDFALVRAKNVLESVVDRPDDITAASRIAKNTMLLIKGFDVVSLGCFGEYTWHRITDVSQDFYLSSVSHLVFESDFICLFQKNREWYFGYCDERLFSVCVASDCPVTPFVNAQDCSSYCKDSKSGRYYHAVGIALLDDGQYFYKIKP